ncbi:MAG: energy transducer TonB [Pyrinomonadaceae bacterium]
MFDKLIASEPEGAALRNRRNYFLVSSLIVGVLFAAAVVVSLYAADIGLGSTSFELVEIIAPVDMAAPEPQSPQPRPASSSSVSASNIPTRTEHLRNINETPLVPTSVSTTPNTQLSRPLVGKYEIGDLNSDPVGAGSPVRGISGGGSDTGLSTASETVAETVKETLPPPPVRRDPPIETNPPVKSLGVVNGRASYLPKPVYSAAAQLVQAKGKVDVQVMIDEKGNVVAANAVSGHPILRAPAEQAARNAKFTPTYLSKVPVKVSGMIIYNFIR